MSGIAAMESASAALEQSLQASTKPLAGNADGEAGRGRIRPRSDLSNEEKEAWSFRGFGTCVKEQGEQHVEAFVKKVQKMDWGDRAEVVQALIQTFNKTRAKRAGLRLRKDKNLSLAEAELKQSEKALATLERDVQELKSKREELQQLLKNDDFSDKFNEAQDQTSLLKEQVEEIQEHIQDLRAAAARSGKPKEAKVEPASCPSNMGRQLNEAKARLSAARKKLTAFNGEASEFESLKRSACGASESLQTLTLQVQGAQDKLAQSQQGVATKKIALESISAAVSRVLTNSMQTKESTSARNMATALFVLSNAGGEMMVADWKEEIAKALEMSSSSKTIQIVYGLVANSLVTIDRTQAEPRAVAFLH